MGAGSLLGIGSFGAVYKGTHGENSIAIKVISYEDDKLKEFQPMNNSVQVPGRQPDGTKSTPINSRYVPSSTWRTLTSIAQAPQTSKVAHEDVDKDDKRIREIGFLYSSSQHNYS